MSHQYTPADSFPASYLVPDDGDPLNAASVDVALQALGDRTQNLSLHSPRLQTQVVNATTVGALTVPARVTRLGIKLYGGGGGGGGGKSGQVLAGTNRAVPGGGGGAGALQAEFIVNVTAGQVLDVTIGAGGAGGAAGAAGAANNGANGSDGGDSIVAVTGGGAELARAKGGLGGSGATIETTSPTTTFAFAPGGYGTSAPTSAAARKPANFTATITAPILPQGQGAGGASMSREGGTVRSYPGATSIYGFDGGVEGDYGTTDGAYYGGGGGGGGGAGPGGVGGGGTGTGKGGNGSSTVNGANGTVGTAGAANTGAGGQGGGGGGAGPNGSGNNSAGGTGGAGGSGRVVFFWVQDT
jgi:hypothetical protein